VQRRMNAKISNAIEGRRRVQSETRKREGEEKKNSIRLGYTVERTQGSEATNSSDSTGKETYWNEKKRRPNQKRSGGLGFFESYSPKNFFRRGSRGETGKKRKKVGFRCFRR